MTGDLETAKIESESLRVFAYYTPEQPVDNSLNHNQNCKSHGLVIDVFTVTELE